MKKELPNKYHVIKADDGYWYVETKLDPGMNVVCSAPTERLAIEYALELLAGESEE